MNPCLFFFLMCVLFSNFIPQTLAAEIREALLADTRGDVTLKKDGGSWEPAMPGVYLKEKDEIKTGPNGYAELLVDGGDSARLEIKENSYFKLHTMGFDEVTGDKATMLDLAIGKVMVHAEKLKGDSKFEVRTPTSTTGVRGTAFEVNVEKNS